VSLSPHAAAPLRHRAAGLRRTGKSCRLRWVNYLHPDLRRGRITADEERLIIALHAELGNKYGRPACIAATCFFAAGGVHAN